MRLGVRTCATAGVVVVALATSSCAGSAGSSEQPGSTAPTGGAAASEPARTDTEAVRYDEPEAKPAAADLSNFRCRQRASERWSASGDITNSTSKPMIYTLTVVTVEGTDDVTAEHIKEFVLKPSESTTFDVRRFARGSADLCMPRLMRTPR